MGGIARTTHWPVEAGGCWQGWISNASGPAGWSLAETQWPWLTTSANTVSVAALCMEQNRTQRKTWRQQHPSHLRIFLRYPPT